MATTEMIRVTTMTDPDRNLVNVLTPDERLIALRDAGRRKVASMNTTVYSADDVLLALVARRAAQLAQTEECPVDEILRDAAAAKGTKLTDEQAAYDAGAAILETHTLVFSESFPISSDPGGRRRAEFAARWPIAGEILTESGDMRVWYVGLVPRTVEIPAEFAGAER